MSGDASDFEVLRDVLLRLDPDTRADIIETIRILRDLPVPVAVRVLADAALLDQLRSQPLVATLR